MNFMNQAFIMAKKAVSHNDIPIGAVIVKNNKIIAKSENCVEKYKNPTKHAEILVIDKAVKQLNNKFLYDCDIYITLEPCIMCCLALSFARINSIYYACSNKKTGGITDQIFEKNKNLWVPKVIFLEEYEEKSKKLLQCFFSTLR